MTNPESRFLVVARHGELENPSGKMYNRDSSVKPEDIIHISNEGEQQMEALGEALLEKGFVISKIYTSPQTRAVESSKVLSKKLGDVEILITPDLDEVLASGPVEEGMTLDSFFKTTGGNVYDKLRWGKYNHEDPKHVILRMRKVGEEAIKELKNGETAILVSHGDSNAWYLNTLNGEPIPNPANLRNLIYPAKGEAVVLSISPDNKFSVIYTLPEHQENRNIY